MQTAAAMQMKVRRPPSAKKKFEPIFLERDERWSRVRDICKTVDGCFPLRHRNLDPS